MALFLRLATLALFVLATAITAAAWEETPAGSGNWSAESGVNGELTAQGGNTVTVGAGAEVAGLDMAVKLESMGYTLTIDADGAVGALHRVEDEGYEATVTAVTFTQEGGLDNAGLVEANVIESHYAAASGVLGEAGLTVNNTGNIIAVAETTEPVDPRAGGVAVLGELQLDNQGSIGALAKGEGPSSAYGVGALFGGQVENSGFIIAEAVSGQDEAVAVGVIAGGGLELVNSGIIAAKAASGVDGSARAHGVYLYDAVFTNTGEVLVQAENSHAETAGLWLSDAEFINNGSVESTGFSVFSATDTTEIVRNFGLLGGDVNLGGGDDLFAAGGESEVDGYVDAGAGTDLFSLTGSGVFDMDIRHFELMDMYDAGTWTLAAELAVSQSALVSGGTLLLQESLTAPEILVAHSGVLAGRGTANGVVTNESLIAPGNDGMGQITVNGGYVHTPDGELAVDLSPDGQSDVLAVEGAPGTAQLQGGALSVAPEYGLYVDEQRWDVLLAQGGVTGEFGSVDTPNLVVLDFSANYLPSAVQLQVDRNSYADFALECDSRQKAAGEYLDSMVSEAVAELQGELRDVIIAIDFSATEVAVQQALAALHPEPYESFADLGLNAGRVLRSGVRSRLQELRFADAGKKRGLFARFVGGQGGLDEACDRTGYGWDAKGAVAGLDYRIDMTSVVGLYAGYGESNLNLDGPYASADEAKHWTTGVYGTFFGEDWYVEGLAGYAHHDFGLDRHIRFGQFDETARGDFDGRELTAMAAAGKAYALDRLLYGPEISLEYTALRLESFTEDGAGNLGLEVAARDIQSLRSGLGLWAALPQQFTGWRLVPTVKGVWKHDFLEDDDPLQASFIGDPTDNFMEIERYYQGRDVLELSVGVTAYIDALSLSAGYVGEFVRQEPAHTGQLGLGYAF